MSMKSITKPFEAGLSTSLIGLMVVIGFALVASAQSFSSGSNGTDGAFDLTGTAAGSTVTFVPSNFPGDQHSLNIFNFTSITIPIGVTVRLSSKNLNGPVIWLASGAVDIEGTIDLSGQQGLPSNPILDGRRRAVDAGAGGYAGGVGGKSDGSTTSTSEPLALPGDGPGGGAAGGFGGGCDSTGGGGKYTGNSLLVPLVGGSGGGGGLFSGPLGSSPYGAGGGAGGGALLIASSTTITVNGTINANGGAPGSNGAGYMGGGGSGGGIRLAANTIAGTGILAAAGGIGGVGGCFPVSGGAGVVRIEAFTDTFTGSISGTQTMGSPFGLFLPTIPPASVTVVSVSNTDLPPSPTGSLAAPDVTINTSSPVTLLVRATFIPVGTVITLRVFSDNNTDQTVRTTALAGTLPSSQATATVTFPNGYSLNYVKATWTTTN